MKRRLARAIGGVGLALALLTGGAVGGATSDADGDGIPVLFDPDADTLPYAKGVSKMRISATYDIVEEPQGSSTEVSVFGFVTPLAGWTFGVLKITGKRADGSVTHKRVALVLGGGVTAGSEEEVYVRPALQICYDAGNPIPWSFCSDQYLMGRGAPGTDFVVAPYSNGTPYATAEWRTGSIEIATG